MMNGLPDCTETLSDLINNNSIRFFNTFAKKMAGFMNVNSISVKNTEASVSHFEG